MFLRKTEHNIPEKRYPHTEGDFSLAGLSFREKIRKMRQDPRGIEVGQLIWIVVGVLAASALGVFIYTQVTDTGSTIESAGSGTTVTYSADCDVSRLSSFARIIGQGTATPGGANGYIQYNLSEVITEAGVSAELQRTGDIFAGGPGGSGTLSAEDIQTSGLEISTLRIFESGGEGEGNFIGISIADLNDSVFILPTGAAGTSAAAFRHTATHQLAGTAAEIATAFNDSSAGQTLASSVLSVNRAQGCWGFAV